MGKAKYLLLISVTALIIIGLSYAMALQRGFEAYGLADATLIEFIPDECTVTKASDGVLAGIEFRKNILGDIIDRTNVSLSAKAVYAGAYASYRLTSKNISGIPLSVDKFVMHITGSNKKLQDSIYFSGSVKIYKSQGTYYDELGSFDKVRINDLADNLTNILKYRKIDVSERLVLELKQQFDGNSDGTGLKGNLTYKLIPTFIQYFPKSGKTTAVEK